MRFRGAVKWTTVRLGSACIISLINWLTLSSNNALPSGDMIEMDDLPAACAFEKSRVIRAAIDLRGGGGGGGGGNDVALYCSKTSASDAAITAGLSCKRNSGAGVTH